MNTKIENFSGIKNKKKKLSSKTKQKKQEINKPDKDPVQSKR